MVWRCSWKNNNTILWRNTSKFMEVLAESSLIIKLKNENVLKWLTYYVHRKLLRGEGFFQILSWLHWGGWGYKSPKNVLRSMWLIPYHNSNFLYKNKIFSSFLQIIFIWFFDCADCYHWINRGQKMVEKYIRRNVFKKNALFISFYWYEFF